MIKQIRTDQLKPGMFIHDLNCGWMDHSFLSNAFLVKDQATVDKVRSLGVNEIYIDTVKGADLWIERPKTDADHERRMQELAQKKAEKAPEVSVRDEVVRARRLHGEASKAMKNALDSVRFGQAIELEHFSDLVDGMVQSVFRNQDALLPLARLKKLDDYTFEHSVGVSALLTAFGRTMKFSPDEVRELALGGLLHDIGKAAIPDSLINKPGKLSDIEFAQMKTHVNEGLEMVKASPGVSDIVLRVVAEHHERVDGSGYPNRLKKDQLSLPGQMAAIVDVYDAMTADKAYSRGMAPTQALKKLLEWSKSQFDPQLVQSFIRSIGIYPTGTLVRLESNRMGVVIEQNEGNLLKPVVRLFYHAVKNHYVPPETVDLSKSLDSVASCEHFDKWKIDPFKWLPG